MNQVMDSTEIIIWFFNYFLFNYMVKKIDDRKIEHKPNTETFFLYCNNLIKKQNKTNYETEFSINLIS
jgi:hypothetical protein